MPARPLALLVTLSLVTSLTGCAHKQPAPAPPVQSTWYLGTLGYFDYFHYGDDPAANTNFRLARGDVDVGERFHLTMDPAQWRRMKHPAHPPTTEPAPPATGPAMTLPAQGG